jgi:hypothetical protein
VNSSEHEICLGRINIHVYLGLSTNMKVQGSWKWVMRKAEGRDEKEEGGNV